MLYVCMSLSGHLPEDTLPFRLQALGPRIDLWLGQNRRLLLRLFTMYVIFGLHNLHLMLFRSTSDCTHERSSSLTRWTERLILVLYPLGVRRWSSAAR